MKSFSHLQSFLDYQERIFSKIGSDHFVEKYVLDLGCGFGENTILIAKFAKKTIGVDAEEFQSWKDYAMQNASLSFLKTEASSLPFADSVFDVVYARNLLHHVKDPDAVLLEAKRVVKKSGKVIIAEGNRYNPIFWIHMTKILKHEHFTRRQFMNLIKIHFSNASFSSFEAQYFPTELPIIHLVEKWWERMVEKMRAFRPFLSYNVAIIESVSK